MNLGLELEFKWAFRPTVGTKQTSFMLIYSILQRIFYVVTLAAQYLMVYTFRLPLLCR